jgi:hypothetical protein
MFTEINGLTAKRFCFLKLPLLTNQSPIEIVIFNETSGPYWRLVVKTGGLLLSKLTLVALVSVNYWAILHCGL